MPVGSSVDSSLGAMKGKVNEVSEGQGTGGKGQGHESPAKDVAG